MTSPEFNLERRPPPATYFHHTGKDVEAVYPFPDDLKRRAVRVTGAGHGHIDPDILKGGLHRITSGIVEIIRGMFREELSCQSCEGCGLGQQMFPKIESANVGIMGFNLGVGVDRAHHLEDARPDRPQIVAYIRCYNALREETDENYCDYARAQVEGLPAGLQFDAHCHNVMGELARASFDLFDDGLRRVERALA